MTYGFDLLGRMTSAAQTGNSLSFTWDALGRNLTQAGPHGTLTSTWDLGGRRTRIVHPDGFFADYDYLVTGEVAAIRENGATSGIGVLATFAYDDLGRRTSLIRGNGTSTGYSYDPVSRLQQLTQELAGSANDLTLGFTYNPAGQIASNTRSNDLYSWDGLAAGTVADTHDGFNRIAQTGAAATAYDARGNVAWEGTQSYTYSSENRLTRIVNSTWAVDLSHDPLGRYNGYSNRGNRQNASDGDQLIWLKKDNAFLSRAVFGPGLDEPLYHNDNQGRRFWTAADERGSIIALADETGTVTWAARFDEYGKCGPATILCASCQDRSWRRMICVPVDRSVPVGRNGSDAVIFQPEDEYPHCK